MLHNLKTEHFFLNNFFSLPTYPLNLDIIQEPHTCIFFCSAKYYHYRLTYIIWVNICNDILSFLDVIYIIDIELMKIKKD